MIPQRVMLERRVVSALEATPRRIPVLLGPCGSGRSSTLLRLRDQIGRSICQYVDAERVATTPERFLHSLRTESPFAPPAAFTGLSAGSAREAFDALLVFLTAARAQGGEPATFLLDEFLELRTFESFPGLRSVLRDLVAALGSSGNRFVLTSRYVFRAQRLLRDAPAQFEIIPIAPLSAAETQAGLADGSGGHPDEDLTRVVHALGDGRPAYVQALASATLAMRQRGPGDPIAALAALLAPEGALFAACRFCYELRLHRARGYGALKAILEVLAEQEPLTLTEIAQRLRRTPGSTKDYLSRLEDVDLVESRQKRYRFADPIMRLWVRLHCRPAPIGDDDLTREVHAYAVARLPQVSTPPAPVEPSPVLAMAGASDGIIEID
jgi:hypothetical protein